MSVTTTQETAKTQLHPTLEIGVDPYLRIAGALFVVQAAGWALLFTRWLTFSALDWNPFPAELALAEWPPILAYIIYGALFLADLAVGLALIRHLEWGRKAGLFVAGLTIALSLVYFYLTREFYGAVIIFGLAGLLMVLLMRHAPWSLAYLSAFWLIIFFIAPMLIVLVVSLGERSFRGTVVYPEFSWAKHPPLF